MSTSQDKTIKQRLSEGVIAFPVTPFGPDLQLDTAQFARHIAHLASHGPAALVAAGGAGELFSLSLEEQATACRIAVENDIGVPVIAGVGQGMGVAIAAARAAEKMGAAAILLFPPYLVNAEQDGLLGHAEAVCRSVDIDVLVYSRDNGVMTPDTALRLADACPNFIALKDGTGNFESLVDLKGRAGDRLVIVNGVPTAEIIAAQCFAAGIRTYTSAVFTFLPELAMHYYRAVRDDDRATVARLLAQFFVPLTEIRRRRRGYAVAIVKAGLRLTGRPAGPVRPPLVELSPKDERDLQALIERAADLIPAPFAARAVG